MEEKKNYQKGIVVGLAGGILGTFICAAICVVIAINLFVIQQNVKVEEQTTEPATLETESDTALPTEDKLLNEEFMKRVDEIYGLLEENFLYDIDADALRDGMYQGLMSALGDPYSTYYNEEALTSFQESTTGKYYGIGVQVSQNMTTGIITMVKPFKGAPGYEAGILPNDILYAVNGVEVTGMDLTEVVTMIKGEAGTTVELTLVREGEQDYIVLDVERREVEVPTVEIEMLDNQIGYMLITGFEEVTASQFLNGIAELSTQGMQGLVIDIRNNPGGRLDVVVSMLDMILPEGVLVYTEDKYGNRANEFSSNPQSVLNVPLAVLVNGESASASEIFAGDIQDFGVGTIVGTQTYGKGIVQTVYPLDDGDTAVKMTVSSYFTHAGRNIHKVGITPDIVVELDEELRQKAEITKEEDNQLQAAIEVLMQQLGQQE
ncbi:MAG: S41 family peptidase [Lachnospiraceae bacterium]|nr:S41 family peptidase [Lachnospiraceae bacterium]